MSDENACPICLEPLLQGVIGTVVPCGHCFHQQCWEAWSSNGKHAKGKGVKCAMCNEGSKLFCRIFLEMNNATKDDCENDDDDDEDTGSGHCNSPQNEYALAKLNEYKRKAKQLNQRVKVLESQRKQQAREHRKLAESYDNTRCQLAEQKDNVEELKTELENVELQLHDARLQLVRNQRELETTESILADHITKLEELSAKNQSIEQRYQKKLKEAQAASLAEVQHILLDHPKLCDENRRLKEELVRSKTELFNLKQRYECASSATDKDARSASRKRKLLQAVAKSRDAYNENQRQQAKQEQKDDLQKQLQNKVSVQAARMSRASDKKVKAPASDVVDFLVSMKPSLSTSTRIEGKRKPFDTIASTQQPQKKGKSSLGKYFGQYPVRSK